MLVFPSWARTTHLGILYYIWRTYEATLSSIPISNKSRVYFLWCSFSKYFIVVWIFISFQVVLFSQTLFILDKYSTSNPVIFWQLMWFLFGQRHMLTKHWIIFISIGFCFVCNLTVSGIRLFFEKDEMLLLVALDTVFINFQIFLLEFHSLSHLFLKLCFNVVHILFTFSYWLLFALLFDWFFHLH